MVRCCNGGSVANRPSVDWAGLDAVVAHWLNLLIGNLESAIVRDPLLLTAYFFVAGFLTRHLLGYFA
jgi:N-methylhydantoinase B/oxoprolinase/acetone carboxylase alpha subunit